MNEDNITKNILNKINDPQIKMRPKNYFTLQNVILTALSLIVFALIVLFINIQFHAVIEHNAFRYLTIKEYGVLEFIQRAPFLNFFFGLVLIVALITVLLNLGKFYKTGRLKLFIIIAILMTIFGLALDISGVGDILDDLPFFKSLYLFKRDDSEIFLTGIVETQKGNYHYLLTKDSRYQLDFSKFSYQNISSIPPLACETIHGRLEGLTIIVSEHTPSKSCSVK